MTVLSAPPGSTPPAKSVGRMVTLTVFDQGCSSLSNFALSVLIARQSGARELGVFAIVITTYMIGQGLIRAMTSECLLTRAGVAGDLRTKFERSGYLFAFLSACLLSLGVLGVAAVVGGQFAVPFVILAVCFPAIAVQDFARYIGICRHEPMLAIRLDVAWLLLFAIGVGVEYSAHRTTMPWLFGAWTVAGAVAGLSTLPLFFSVRNWVSTLRFWISNEWSVGSRYAGQYLIGMWGGYGVFYFLVLVLSLDAIGLLKNTQVALSPIIVLFAGLDTALMSIVSRKMREDRRQGLRFIYVVSVALPLTLMAWSALIYFAPVRDVARLLGPSWPQARPYLLWLGVANALGTISAATLIGMRSIRSAKELLRVGMISLPFMIVLELGAAKLGGIRGLAVGIGIYSIFLAIVSWVVFWRALGRYEPDQLGEPEAAEDELIAMGGNEPSGLLQLLAGEPLLVPWFVPSLVPSLVPSVPVNGAHQAIHPGQPRVVPSLPANGAHQATGRGEPLVVPSLPANGAHQATGRGEPLVVPSLPANGAHPATGRGEPLVVPSLPVNGDQSTARPGGGVTEPVDNEGEARSKSISKAKREPKV